MYNQTLHLIVAEDDAEDRSLISQAITTIGVGVKLSFAKNGMEVLRVLDVIVPIPYMLILDLNMPFMDGFTHSN